MLDSPPGTSRNGGIWYHESRPVLLLVTISQVCADITLEACQAANGLSYQRDKDGLNFNPYCRLA
jgi:hypothetical protein